ncbi:MAG: hypothetical protein JWM80_4726 [Cyanobacteria bacterium RYN_339]|nr:hypothetical protein [Cyanobacteria bacterium RYN_339]
MERKIIYFPEPSATTAVLDHPVRRDPAPRNMELAALTAAIRQAEAIAGNFTGR